LRGCSCGAAAAPERYASKGNWTQVYALQMLVEAFGCSSGDTETAQGVRKRLPSSSEAASFLRENVLPLNIFGMQGANVAGADIDLVADASLAANVARQTAATPMEPLGRHSSAHVAAGRG